MKKNKAWSSCSVSSYGPLALPAAFFLFARGHLCFSSGACLTDEKIGKRVAILHTETHTLYICSTHTFQTKLGRHVQFPHMNLRLASPGFKLRGRAFGPNVCFSSGGCLTYERTGKLTRTKQVAFLYWIRHTHWDTHTHTHTYFFLPELGQRALMCVFHRVDA